MKKKGFLVIAFVFAVGAGKVIGKFLVFNCFANVSWVLHKRDIKLKTYITFYFITPHVPAFSFFTGKEFYFITFKTCIILKLF
mgnify:CR=1 FL=1